MAKRHDNRESTTKQTAAQAAIGTMPQASHDGTPIALPLESDTGSGLVPADNCRNCGSRDAEDLGDPVRHPEIGIGRQRRKCSRCGQVRFARFTVEE